MRKLYILRYRTNADYGPADRNLSRNTLCNGKLPCSVGERDHELVFGQRGQRNIENDIVFRSNPGFIFHDSSGLRQEVKPN